MLYLTFTADITKLYQGAHRGAMLFLINDGGVYPLMFWLGQIVLGSLAPLLILAFGGWFGMTGRRSLVAASALFLFGGLCQLYVIIIGGQAYPLDIFPGYRASSAFFDDQAASYTPSWPELFLGLSGVSASMMIAAIALRLLPFLPTGVTAQQDQEAQS